MRVPVDLVVNSYERTYREVLVPDFFNNIEYQNQVEFSERIAVINNVDNPADARRRANRLRDTGELTDVVFVHERLPEALRYTQTGRRSLGSRPYFVDYAIVMATCGASDFILGWDAEVTLESSSNWIEAAIELMLSRTDVMSASPRWPARSFDTLDEETISSAGDWRLTWGFSDQVWLTRREDLRRAFRRRLVPASLARHAPHPFSFEARMESYQRSLRRYRAVHSGLGYRHNDLAPVIQRLGGMSARETLQVGQLQRLNRCLRRLGSQDSRLRLP